MNTLQSFTIINSVAAKIGLFGLKIQDVSFDQLIFSDSSLIIMITCFFSNITIQSEFMMIKNSNFMNIFQDIKVQNTKMSVFGDFFNISGHLEIKNSLFSNSNCKFLFSFSVLNYF